MEKGERVNIAFAPKEKETSPPRHYTIETLNNYLKNPFREDKAAAEDADDREEYRAMFEGLELGTEATRTGIIGNAIKSQYIALKKDTYYLQPAGAYLIEELTRMGISMDKYKTSQLGQSLKKVYRGEIAIRDSVALAKQEIDAVFHPTPTAPEEDTDTGLYGDTVGTCPLCGGTVAKGRYNYGCLSYKEGCKFRIYTSMCGRTVPISAARELLTQGKTRKLRGFISKKGNPFEASLKLEDGKAVFDF